jgi:hypothetical protein
MIKYPISLPSEAMVLTVEGFPAVATAARAVIAEAEAAGVYLFAGGISDAVDPVPVAGDGGVSAEIYPGSRIRGRFTVLELPTREHAVGWAQKISVASRYVQELREFMYDRASWGQFRLRLWFVVGRRI